MVKASEMKSLTQLDNNQKDSGYLQTPSPNEKTSFKSHQNQSPGPTKKPRSKSRSPSHSASRKSSQVHFSESTKELPKSLFSDSRPQIQMTDHLMDASSLRCLEDPTILSAVLDKPLEKASINHLLDKSEEGKESQSDDFEPKGIKKSKTFIFTKKGNENILTEIDTSTETLTEDQTEEHEYHISTSELLDPEVPVDQLSSSKSTPGNLSKAPDEVVETEQSQEPKLRKILGSKRSTSATRPSDSGTALVTAAAASAVATHASLARRRLSERRGLLDMETGGDALLAAALPRRRCRLFPFGLDLRDPGKKVGACRSMDGEWSISDHPNHKVLPTGPLFAQESAFPAFYDKIEIPVPLPPWDDPGFSTENEQPPPPLQPQQPPAQSPSALQPKLSHSLPPSKPTSRAPSRSSCCAGERTEYY